MHISEYDMSKVFSLKKPAPYNMSEEKEEEGVEKKAWILVCIPFQRGTALIAGLVRAEAGRVLRNRGVIIIAFLALTILAISFSLTRHQSPISPGKLSDVAPVKPRNRMDMQNEAIYEVAKRFQLDDAQAASLQTLLRHPDVRKARQRWRYLRDETIRIEERSTLVLKALIENYAPLHEQNVRDILQGDAENGKIIVLTAASGWADRVKSFASSLMMAVILRRGIVIDHRDPVPLHHFLSPAYIDWRVDSLPSGWDEHLTKYWIKSINKDVRDGAIWKEVVKIRRGKDTQNQQEGNKAASTQILPVHRQYANFSVLYLSNVYGSMCETLLKKSHYRAQLGAFGIPSETTCDDIMRAAFRFLFHPSPRFQSLYTAQVESLQWLSQPVLGLQVRMGGQWGDSQLMTIQQAVEMRECARNLEDITGWSNKTKWFLATDNSRLMKSWVEKDMSNKLLVVNGTIENILGMSSSNNKAWDVMSKMMLDWWLLGHCDVLFCTPSSNFGNTAAAIFNRIAIHRDLSGLCTALKNAKRAVINSNTGVQLRMVGAIKQDALLWNDPSRNDCIGNVMMIN